MGRYESVTAHTLRLIKEITRSPEQTALDIYYDTESCISVKKKSQVRSPAELPGCPSKPPLAERPLLGIETAAELARVYETLANDTRIRILHVLLKEGEIYPSALAAKLGMKPQAVSNQLQRLSDRGIVQTRREGNNVLYRIVDPCVIDLVDRGLCLLEDTRASQARR
jgi:ArsR family transcriptional regulator, lead/cadmium/zinc/bismuth-responsive transcriptional repressor